MECDLVNPSKVVAKLYHMDQKKTGHHTVWQYYLQPWTKNGRISCLHDGELLPKPHTSNVAKKNHFYRLKELSEDEFETIDALINLLPPELQEINRDWLRYFQAPFYLRELNRAINRDDEELEVDIDKDIDVLISNAEENLHESIEKTGKPHLESLRNRDASFFYTHEGFAEFIHFIIVQYLRTRKILHNLISSLDDYSFIDVDRAIPVMRHIFATNICFAFEAHKQHYWLQFLESPNGAEFITGDQPVVNTYSRGLLPTGIPEHVELYYPIGPQLAVLLGDERDRPRPGNSILSSEDVHIYNKLIFDSAYQQVFASHDGLLRDLMEL